VNNSILRVFFAWSAWSERGVERAERDEINKMSENYIACHRNTQNVCILKNISTVRRKENEEIFVVYTQQRASEREREEREERHDESASLA
jgi:hypothetical protein